MRCLFIITLLFALTTSTNAQPDSIISSLRSINNEIINIPCYTSDGRLISNRALNLFVGYKVSSYLSNVEDFSFYKNNIIINTADGTVAVNHNVFEAKGKDEPIKSVFFFGVKANVGEVFVQSVLNKKINNEFSVNLKQTWIGKYKMHFDKCLATAVSNPKQVMDAERAIILKTLEAEINEKSNTFETALNSLNNTNASGQNFDSAKAFTAKKFYRDLDIEYARKFAELQAAALDETKTYNVISTSWTSVTAYIPITTEKLTVAETLNASLQSKRSYAASIGVNHTSFWESRKAGRFFLTLTGDVNWNNAKNSFALTKINFVDYKNLGGSDTIHAVQLKDDNIYLGNYKNFVTPVLKARLVYFPPEYHFGLSFLVEQNLGNYNVLNGTLGIPIVLIDKKALPALNLEFQFHFFDLTDKLYVKSYASEKTFIGLTVGIPFSKIVY